MDCKKTEDNESEVERPVEAGDKSTNGDLHNDKAEESEVPAVAEGSDVPAVAGGNRVPAITGESLEPAVAGESQVPSFPGEATLSKSQLKKQLKKQKWEQVKTAKRKAEKERLKKRKQACRERGEELGPTRKQLRHNTMSKSNCKVKVVVDCDFDEYMSEKDIKMLVKQIQHSYSSNRRAENPLQFYCCGVNGKTKDRLESMGDYKGWDIMFHSESYTDKFEKSSIVYLSSESENILQTLEDDKVYIIGGLVDHNHHKGLCHSLAEEKGLSHAQLPISDYIDMKTRKVLTINHVFEILLHYTETKDWQKALHTVLPPRKGAVPKEAKSSDVGNNTELKHEDINNDSECCDDNVKDEDILQSNTDSSKHCEKKNSETLQNSKRKKADNDVKTKNCENDIENKQVEGDSTVLTEEKDIVTSEKS